MMTILGVVACSKSKPQPGGAAAPTLSAKEAPTQGGPAPTVPQKPMPNIAVADYTSFQQQRNTAAIAMYRELAKGGPGNFVYSPLSLSTAFAMAYAGASGPTKVEIGSALHFKQPDALLHAGFEYWMRELAARGVDARGADGSAFRLSVANGLFAARDLEIKQPFHDDVEQHYGGGFETVPYATDPKVSRYKINAWVDENTGGKIKDLVPENLVTPETRLMLVNAVYLSAAWHKPFEPRLSEAGVFHAPGGDQTATYMKKLDELRVGKVAGASIVELPFDAKTGLSLMLVLPAIGTLPAVEAKLNEATWSQWSAALKPTLINLHLPRFKLDGETLGLKPVFEALGVRTAFVAGRANFSELATEPLFVGEVAHRAVIEVAEAGVTAAAATAMVALAGGPPSAAPELLRFDRPFLFAVRDIGSGAILFMGRLAVPPAAK